MSIVVASVGVSAESVYPELVEEGSESGCECNQLTSGRGLRSLSELISESLLSCVRREAQNSASVSNGMA